jgi:hypothetical protein
MDAVTARFGFKKMYDFDGGPVAECAGRLDAESDELYYLGIDRDDWLFSHHAPDEVRYSRRAVLELSRPGLRDGGRLQRSLSKQRSRLRSVGSATRLHAPAVLRSF